MVVIFPLMVSNICFKFICALRSRVFMSGKILHLFNRVVTSYCWCPLGFHSSLSSGNTSSLSLLRVKIHPGCCLASRPSALLVLHLGGNGSALFLPGQGQHGCFLSHTNDCWRHPFYSLQPLLCVQSNPGTNPTFSRNIFLYMYFPLLG